jgi:hypothetical protein
MIDYCIGISALALQAANVLLELFESRLDLSTSTIKLNDLLGQEVEIGSEQGKPLDLAVDPNHFDRALKGLEPDAFCKVCDQGAGDAKRFANNA